MTNFIAFFKTLFNEFLLTLKKPKRLKAILKKDELLAYLKTLLLRIKFSNSWTNLNPEQVFARRNYHTYDDYLAHQQSKLGVVQLSSYDIRYREVLRQRLEELNVLHSGMTVLCLGARLGTEVKSFLDLGCFGVGIDINPGDKNRYVLWGDFHDMQFPPRSVDVIFSNSLDHVFDIDKVIDEITRVLKPDGLLIVEAVAGSKEGSHARFFESFQWSKVDDLIALFECSQFRLLNRSLFSYPWQGEQLCFRKG